MFYHLWFCIHCFLFFFKFIWLCQVLVVALGIINLHCGRQDHFFSCGIWTLSCGRWDLILWPGIKPATPAMGAWSLSHWTPREVPEFIGLTDVEVCLMPSVKVTAARSFQASHNSEVSNEGRLQISCPNRVWWAPGVGEGRGSLACYSPWDCKESDTTEQLNWIECDVLEVRRRTWDPGKGV